MQENEITGNTDQSTINQQQESTQSSSPTTSKPETAGSSQLTEKKSKTPLYAAVVVIVIVLLAAAALTLNKSPLKPTTMSSTAATTISQTTTGNTIPTSISPTTIVFQNPYVLLSGIPLASNMADYYTYESNATELNSTTINQYGLPFTKNLIMSPYLPSNYTLKIPQAYSNVSSPIMVFISTTTYSNSSLAQYDYAGLLKNITTIPTIRAGPINDSVLYFTHQLGLSLIGVAFRYKSTVSVILTWGNPKTFTNSSYVSDMALKQYAIIGNTTK